MGPTRGVRAAAPTGRCKPGATAPVECRGGSPDESKGLRGR